MRVQLLLHLTPSLPSPSQSSLCFPWHSQSSLGFPWPFAGTDSCSVPINSYPCINKVNIHSSIHSCLDRSPTRAQESGLNLRVIKTTRTPLLAISDLKSHLRKKKNKTKQKTAKANWQQLCKPLHKAGSYLLSPMVMFTLALDPLLPPFHLISTETLRFSWKINKYKITNACLKKASTN